MDPANIGKDTIVKVTDWLRGFWEMRRRTGPVQQWVDSIPSPMKSSLAITPDRQAALTEKAATPVTPTEPKDIPYSMGTKPPSMTVSAPINVPNVPTISTPGLPSSLPHKLVRDPSLQSDSSHCSSVENLLELRKADPEAILLGLGFGGCPGSPQDNSSLSRIPKRFLHPSKLKGIDINNFVRHQQETSESFDSISLGYRGLTGSPYVAPSEIVQKIMQRLREHESHKHDPYAAYHSHEQYTPQQHNGTFSVLSPDNRQFLERPRSKSPDMRNKRMIIGQKSFAFGHDGDLIEIKPDAKRSFEKDLNKSSNMIGNSEGSRNLEADKVSVEVGEKREEIVPKQLLFDDSIEFSDDTKSPKEHSSSDETIDREGMSLSVSISQNISDIRRASDGSCDVKAGESLLTQGRRHSDSFVHAFEDGSRESVLSQRRKTLKRQTRISDADSISHYDSRQCIPDTIQSKEFSSQKDLNASKTSKNTHNIKESENIKDNRGAECSKAFSKEMDESIQSVDSSLSNESQQDCECCVEKNHSLERARKDDEKSTTCCCSGTTKYWAKMEKIIKKNKNLENMVARNRREMAEIREMLSSVLSVRLEPGF
ncbi:ki-ras-induced actin-interacting protein-IP3R-interacting domain olf186-M [Calliopsis andreniformis]|uniref:ki-ras-induced actin-interacting protein-IP3R-interacting domain olf186-M n=1 Tax=Calliopsis andreniformis TaxID=337506 RepID=UPI003FCD7DF9